MTSEKVRRGGRVRLRIDVAIEYEIAADVLKTLVDADGVVIYTLQIGEDWKDK